MDLILTKLISIKSLDDLSAEELADTINYMIDHEQQPGGPYVFSGNTDDDAINNHLYNLFALKGKLLNKAMKTNSVESIKSLEHSNSPNGKPNNESFYSTAIEYLEPYCDISKSKTILNIVSKVKKADRYGEISNLSYTFYNSLRTAHAEKVGLSQKAIFNLGVANFLTWVAYSLIDIVIDEKSQTDFLPPITFLQRKILHHSMLAGVDRQLLELLFDEVDISNAQEIHQRSNLTIDTENDQLLLGTINRTLLDSLMSGKSIAHSLGPQEIARRIGTNEMDTVNKAMKLYCSARQMNDDLHDWLDDISEGQITFVISKLFNDAQMKTGTYQYRDSLEKMKKVYWDSVLIYCCERIQKDISEATRLLEDSILERNSPFAREFLKPISNTAKNALDKHLFEKDYLAKIST